MTKLSEFNYINFLHRNFECFIFFSFLFLFIFIFFKDVHVWVWESDDDRHPPSIIVYSAQIELIEIYYYSLAWKF